jgi:8-amino-7-oxononanoate synthase
VTGERPIVASYAKALDALREDNLLRSCRVMPHTGGRFTVDGRTLLNMSSNDYLDLSGSDALKNASMKAVKDWGCGATASRLMSGHLALHAALENKLAGFLGTEAALVFGSGFLTNLGVMTALATRGDTLFSDRLNHASLIDGMRLSGATCLRYRHKDLDHLEALLQKDDGKGKRIIVSDSVFSMDGDIAPLEGLAALAESFDALLVIDEAHAVGVFGPQGRGCCAACDVKPDVLIGGMGKAFGGYGGFAATSELLHSVLINRARSFIYSTGLPPASLGSALAALECLEAEPDLGQTLLRKAHALHTMLTEGGVNMPPFESPIIPVPIGPNDAALRVAESLREAGVLATAVRPPTVPADTARLRLSVTLAHSESDLEKVAKEILRALRAEDLL